MNATLQEAKTLTQSILKGLGEQEEVEVVVCPPFPVLYQVGELLAGSRLRLGAQDVYPEPQGAFTGEVSPLLLKDAGCHFCIVGHSERRHILGESEALIHRKFSALLAEGLQAILCVGETLPERQKGQTLAVVERQLGSALEGIPPVTATQQTVIAYEPVWAIGTGHHATPTEVKEVHQAIRAWLHKALGASVAQAVRIPYGGSVKPENADALMAQPDVDGALVGGASLNPKSFLAIVKAAQKAKAENPTMRDFPR